MSFSKKVVLITGASSGIGAAAAVLFCKEGADVVIVGRNENKLHSVVEKCSAVGAKPFIIIADVAKENEAVSIVQNTVDKYEKLDVLVNNAGVIDYASIFKGNLLESFDKVMNTNLRSVVAITSKAATCLTRTKGNIVNVSSTMATTVNPDMTAYCVSKAGLNHFTKIAAKELAASGVRVNIVSPDPVVTDIMQNAGAEGMSEHWTAMTLLNKVGTPEEVADLIMFLASDKAQSITGSDFMIDNGVRLKY